MIAILGVLVILTTTYVGKCLYRLWKSKASHLNETSAELGLCTTSNNERNQIQIPNMYELAVNVEDEPFAAAYDEIQALDILPNHILIQELDKMHEDLMSNSSSTHSPESASNVHVEIEDTQLNHEDVDGAYISPCM